MAEDPLFDALKSLPAPRAPRTLLPRVLAAVDVAAAGQSRPRAWQAWPRLVQVGVAALVVVFVGAGLLVASGVWGLDPSSGAAAWAADRAASVVHAIDATATLMGIVRRVLIQPAIVYALVLMVVLSLSCAAAWSAVTRLALGGASQS